MRELWKSSISGHRRTGTQLGEFRKLFSDNITALAISEPLDCSFYDEPSVDVARKMLTKDFDVVGLKPSEDQPVAGYVQKDELLNGVCSDHMRTFSDSELISESTALTETLTHLKQLPRLFVRSGNIVNGIITRADLQKPIIRIFLFGELTLLEMHMNFWIRHQYPQNTWEGKLHGTRLREAQNRMEQKMKRKEETDLIDCLQLGDKRTITLSDNYLRNVFNIQSAKDGNSLFRAAEDLRNKIAHAQDIVAGTTWGRIISTVEEIEGMVTTSEGYLREAE